MGRALFMQQMRCLYRYVPRRKCQVNARRENKKLFTPGPLGVTDTVKQAMLRDLGSRDTEFVDTVKYIRQTLVQLAGASSPQYTCVPIQGSGTYTIESVLSTTVPRQQGRVLILENGVYGRRQATICDILSIPYHMVHFPENEAVCVNDVREILTRDSDFSTVSVIHCETTTGIINPIGDIGSIVREVIPDACYFVDAMSSFGAMPCDVMASNIDVLVSSANKALEGVPGFAFAIANTEKLLKCKGNARSLAGDMVDQYEVLESTGQFRFTPPVHTMLALKQALIELEQEGGISARAQRYRENKNVLRAGMKKLGFCEYLKDDDTQSDVITTYLCPKHENFDFKLLYSKLNDLDQVIYPGKLTVAECFRIGTIGQLYPSDISHLISCIERVCVEMGVPLPCS